MFTATLGDCNTWLNVYDGNHDRVGHCATEIILVGQTQTLTPSDSTWTQWNVIIDRGQLSQQCSYMTQECCMPYMEEECSMGRAGSPDRLDPGIVVWTTGLQRCWDGLLLQLCTRVAASCDYIGLMRCSVLHLTLSPSGWIGLMRCSVLWLHRPLRYSVLWLHRPYEVQRPVTT